MKTFTAAASLLLLSVLSVNGAYVHQGASGKLQSPNAQAKAAGPVKAGKARNGNSNYAPKFDKIMREVIEKQEGAKENQGNNGGEQKDMKEALFDLLGNAGAADGGVAGGIEEIFKNSPIMDALNGGNGDLRKALDSDDFKNFMSSGSLKDMFGDFAGIESGDQKQRALELDERISKYLKMPVDQFSDHRRKSEAYLKEFIEKRKKGAKTGNDFGRSKLKTFTNSDNDDSSSSDEGKFVEDL